MVRVYGGPVGQNDTFDNHTVIEVGLLNPGQSVHFNTEFLAYVTQGKGKANGTEVSEGDLFRGGSMEFKAAEKTQLIVVHQ